MFLTTSLYLISFPKMFEYSRVVLMILHIYSHQKNTIFYISQKRSVLISRRVKSEIPFGIAVQNYLETGKKVMKFKKNKNCFINIKIYLLF